MGELKIIRENGCSLVFEVLEDGTTAFVHCQKSEYREDRIRENQKDWFRLVELQAAGETRTTITDPNIPERCPGEG